MHKHNYNNRDSVEKSAESSVSGGVFAVILLVLLFSPAFAVLFGVVNALWPVLPIVFCGAVLVTALGGMR